MTTPIQAVRTVVHDQLTEAGPAEAVSLNDVGAKTVSLKIVLAGVGTNVVVGMEYIGDNSDWTDAEPSDTKTLTANGTYHYSYPAGPNYVRPYVYSVSGGTPTVDFVTTVFN